MTLRLLHWSMLTAALLAGLGCKQLPGYPKPGPEVPRPEDVRDFKTLYAENCAACHGENGMNGPSYPLANPEYQALIDDTTLHDWVEKGRSGTMMPGFGPSSGGMLTDAQVDVLVHGMRAAWGHPQNANSGDLNSGNADPNPSRPQGMPAYPASAAGNPQHGLQVYSTACAQCHGPANQATAGPEAPGQPRPGKAGSITDPAFLALVSDQDLRTVTIAGRPDLGQPDWRGDVPGHPLSDAEVTDVVSWLASQRPNPQTGLAPKTSSAGQNPGAANRGNPSMEGQNPNNTRHTIGVGQQPARRPPDARKPAKGDQF